MKVEKILNEDILDLQACLYANKVLSDAGKSNSYDVFDIIRTAFVDGYKLCDNKPYYFDDVKLYDFKLPSGNLWSSPIKDEGNVVNFQWEKALLFDIPTENDFNELVDNTGFVHNNKSVRFEKGNFANIHELQNGFWIRGNDLSRPLYVDSDYKIKPCNINEIKSVVVVKKI